MAHTKKGIRPSPDKICSVDEDEGIVECLVNHIMEDAIRHSNHKTVIKSKTFVLRSDLESDSSISSARMDMGLRIRPDSPTGSYESTSFESLHSDELGESCPLIFSVDDVGSPRPTISNRKSGAVSPMLVGETLKAKTSDSSVITRVNHSFNQHNDSLTQFTERAHHLQQEQPPSSSSDSDSETVANTEIYLIPEAVARDSFHDDSVEYLIERLDEYIKDITCAFDCIFCPITEEGKDVNQLDSKGNSETTPEEEGSKTELQELATSTRDAWQQHKEYLFEFLQDFDRLESQLQEAVFKLRGQAGQNIKLKYERRQFQSYLEDREKEWMICEKNLKTELEFLRSKLYEVSKNNLDSGNVWRMLESLVNIQFDREQAIILDTLKQNKLNEMKLLVFRQQLLIEELQEDNLLLNQELNIQIGNDMIQEHQVKSCQLLSENSNNKRTSSVCDVMYCDRHQYLPHHSTHPELVSLQVFNIGGRHPHLRAAFEDVFQPDSLYLQSTHRDNAAELETMATELYKELTETGPASTGFTLDNTI